MVTPQAVSSSARPALPAATVAVAAQPEVADAAEVAPASPVATASAEARLFFPAGASPGALIAVAGQRAPGARPAADTPLVACAAVVVAGAARVAVAPSA